MTTSDLQPRVELGERVYRELTWTRKDTVYLGSIKIGYIHSSREDRQGRTVSSFDGKSIKGRNIKLVCQQGASVCSNRGKHSTGMKMLVKRP